jgi:tetratricopeptide (TPR) repeat protein
MSSAVDWGLFAGEDGGHRFERFCADLLGAQGYAIEHMAKGGNDEGKDILILHRAKEIAESPTVLCLVECKSRTSRDRKAISLEDINRSLWALFENSCTCLVVFTSHKFNSQAVNCFLRVNERGRIKISWIDQDDLLDLGSRHPEVWRLHFGQDPPAKVSAGSNGNNIRVEGQSRRFFWADDEPLGIVVHNRGGNSGRATLRKDGVIVDEVMLHHHQRAVMRAPQPDESSTDPYRGLTVTFQPDDETYGIDKLSVTNGENLEARRRIDHRFADHGGLCRRAVDALNRGASVHLRGTAGSGKSRLIAECRKLLQGCAFVDLSQKDRGERLLDLLVEHITGWPAHLLATLPDALLCRLSAPESDGDALKLIVEYCAGRRAHSSAAVARALIMLASGTVKALVVDNIQDSTELDEAILQAAISDRKMQCLLSTRCDDADLPARAERIVRAAVSLEELVLDDDLTARLGAFVELVAPDPSSADYLRRLVGSECFQTTMSKLKALRQLGVLEIDQHGNISLVASPREASLGDYTELQNVILYSRLPPALRSACTETVRAAAIFGETFPISFIESLLGDAGIDALDELERRELIRSVPEPGPYGFCFRFDHALTRAAVAGAIPTTRRVRLNGAAARFIEAWPEFQPGSGSYEAAAHFEQGGLLTDALRAFESGARHYLDTGRVGDAQAGLLAALPLFNRLPIERDRASIRRELDLRELLLETALLVALPEDQWSREIEAFQIQSHLFPGVPEHARRLGRAHCFNACFDGYRRRLPEAWREMQKAHDILETIEDSRPLAEALKWGANLQKNLGDYNMAAAMGARAYALYADRGEECRAGEVATELSHIHYEAYRFAEAMRWGELAHTHYAAFGHPGLVARSRIDIARMLAVLEPGELRTLDELDFSVKLARNAGLGPLVAKALLNSGLYCALEQANDEAAEQRFTDADQILRVFPNAYLETLLTFVRLGPRPGRRLNQAWSGTGFGSRLMTWCTHFEMPDQIGDRRLQMMVKALAATSDPITLAWVRRFPGSPYFNYIGIGQGARFAELERGNPLFRPRGFALYY